MNDAHDIVWLPRREVLFARDAEWEDERAPFELFEDSTWDVPGPRRRFCYARVRSRDAAGVPRVTETWVPAGLIPPGTLASLDDKAVLRVLCERNPEAEAVRASESVSFEIPDKRTRRLLLLGPCEAVLRIDRVLYNQDDEPLMVQEIATKDPDLTYHRNLVWEREVCYEKAFDLDIDCL